MSVIFVGMPRGRGTGFGRTLGPGAGDQVQRLRLEPMPAQVSRRRKLKRLQMINTNETNSRIIALLKAAEDGRKRASTLPPLEREPTFQRKPKHFNPYEGTSEEAGDSHWNKSYEKVSIEVNNKVKTHLKRQLLQRFERRLRRMEEAFAGEDGERHGRDYHPWEGKAKQKKSGKKDIFSKYSETGENRDAQLRKNAKGDQPLPEIVTKGVDGTGNGMQKGSSNGTCDDANGHVSDDEKSDDSLTSPRHEEKFDVVEVKSRLKWENFRTMAVSPVQTPHVARPMTREQTRLGFSERMSRILRGHVHITCPLKNRAVRVYLCSGFTESEAERTVLTERVFPELREFCALHGREFQMVDPYWGLRTADAEDHSLPAVCLEQLERCSKDPLQPVHAVVILTDKYGTPVLPNSLQADDFETLYNRVYQSTKSQRSAIAQQIAAIEETLPTGSDGGNEQRVSVTSIEGQASKPADTKETKGVAKMASDTAENTVSQLPEGVRLSRKEAEKRDQQQVKALKDKLSLLPEPELLQEWYRRDDNSQTPVYRLQPISSLIKDYGRGDAGRREQTRQAWEEVRIKLINMIDLYGHTHYRKSLLEIELDHLFNDPGFHGDHCIVVNRTFDDIDAKLDDFGADDFTDVTSTKPFQINVEARNRLRKLRQEIIPSKVNDQQIFNFPTVWVPGGVRIGGERFHQMYLDRMCRQVCDVMKRRLLDSFREEGVDTVEENELFAEVAEHVLFFQDRSRRFQGMKETLQVIKGYTRSNCHAPLIVHGKPGCGKSAVLAKAAKETFKWLKGKSACVLVRSVGATQASRNIRHLLYDICRQLCVAYNVSHTSVPTDYVSLVNDLTTRLSLAKSERPLVIYLDALDRLKDDHHGRTLSWLPKVLPDHVHVIVSTLPDDNLEILPSAKSLLGDDTGMFLEIPDLQESDSMVIMNHLCNIHNHSLTQSQFDIRFNMLNKCPSPLYLTLIFEDALNWRSYTEINESKLPDTVKKFAAVKFVQMEVKFGEAFVRRALGYVTAARNGLTDHEMLDLLSLDDTVMAEVATSHPLVRRRIPPSMWLRLRKELSMYLCEISADNVRTIQWAHSDFHEAAVERYLKQRDKAPSYHKAVAEYFSGVWVDKPKPFPGSEKGVLRHVALQPLCWQPKDAKNDGAARVYNLRKINELPHHLLRSQQTQLYKSEAMCNFEWVLAKLCGTSLRGLVEEYHIGLEADPLDQDLKLLSDTLQLSATAVLRDPRQLAGQLVGRLQGIVNRDVPATPGDPPKYPYLHALVAQAKNTSIPALVPSICCLTEPGGILYDLLCGHTKQITAVTTTTDAQKALTAAEDNTLKVWDLKSGKVSATIHEFGKHVSILRTALNNKYVIAVEANIIRIWSLMTKERCLVIDQYLDPPVISIASEGKLLVAFFDGVGALRTWDLEDNFKHVSETKIEGTRVYSDNAVVLAQNSYGDYVLHAFRGSNSATIQHARTGKVIHKLQCHDNSSSIVALAITRDYMILACRQQYMKLHEIHQLEMFDAKKGKYLRSIRGCMQDSFSEIHINLVGSHAIAVCASEASNTSNIMIWNLETEDHKHLAKHSGVSTVSACADFRYCLTAQKGDNTLKIWNISKFINLPMPKLKKSLGVAEIHPMVDNPRYAVARQVNHGPISIWNVAKAKCLANAVRIERGLSESSDVVLIRNCNVVILTERGLKDSKPVFKTVLIYDLRAKRYTKKLTSCNVVPSQAHEYFLLDDETLLGPAETRNHLITWSLVTGKELYRVRTQFSDIGLKGNIRDVDLDHSMQMRASTAKLTPWDRRTESSSAKRRRREKERDEEKRNLEERQKEKQNGIEQFIVSGNLNIVVASFFAHHLVVFNLSSKLHTQTLENENSMLFLHVAALNFDGCCLVHANYDEASKVSYVSLWDTESGQVKKRLKNETDVLAIAITDDGNRVVFGKANKELRIWDPNRKSSDSMKSIKGYDSLEFNVNSRIFILNDGTRAVVFAGDISLWDLENATLLAAFTPDTRIEVVSVAMSGQLITMGVHEFPELIVLKMSGRDVKPIADTEHEDLFGETTGDTSDEEEEDEGEA
ncbi:uncharacterized protein LOC127853228 isoform X2 [Dreissena polymorpha]|uniref:uncharacterized protein LOC127853228 isoform X2 n=1 Tax=Dreissena polymorpha TaxID=45954 RepID=UPI002264F114|nr:uncharacterized protein LOC127853228 isoform X2 [Dreissena polymorpha]